jgi:hypothetical protein
MLKIILISFMLNVVPVCCTVVIMHPVIEGIRCSLSGYVPHGDQLYLYRSEFHIPLLDKKRRW